MRPNDGRGPGRGDDTLRVGRPRPSVDLALRRFTHTVRAVGWVVGGRGDIADTDEWGSQRSVLALTDEFDEQAMTGLADFSHVEVLFMFDRLEERDDYRSLRRSRGRDDLPPVGVFADRGPRRPNRIGATICRIVSVDGTVLVVEGLDAVVGTPVLDIKPVMNELVPSTVVQPAWSRQLMARYVAPTLRAVTAAASDVGAGLVNPRGDGGDRSGGGVHRGSLPAAHDRHVTSR